ncbi:hypothetical protein SDC9_104356 [bioreactor metagenome]|uniref:Uncharacterized protein n=1 Tax=bioreactor metagenome TaxID=1076179 RepID=A0A645B752_9ZZZZ
MARPGPRPRARHGPGCRTGPRWAADPTERAARRRPGQARHRRRRAEGLRWGTGRPPAHRRRGWRPSVIRAGVRAARRSARCRRCGATRCPPDGRTCAGTAPAPASARARAAARAGPARRPRTSSAPREGPVGPDRGPRGRPGGACRRPRAPRTAPGAGEHRGRCARGGPTRR